MVKNTIFQESNTLKLLVAFKMAYSCCFSLGVNLDFLDFSQKNFFRPFGRKLFEAAGLLSKQCMVYFQCNNRSYQKRFFTELYKLFYKVTVNVQSFNYLKFSPKINLFIFIQVQRIIIFKWANAGTCLYNTDLIQLIVNKICQ